MNPGLLAAAFIGATRWWARHPWVVWWILGTILLMLTAPLFGYPTAPWSAVWLGRAVWYATYAQGMRVTWRHSRIMAVLLAALFALPRVSPLQVGLGSAAPGPSGALLAFPVLALGGPLAGELIVRAVRRDGGYGSPVAGLPALRRLLWGLGVFGCCLAIVSISAPVKIRWAQRQAEALCARAVVGGPVEGFDARARELGLQVSQRMDARDPSGRALREEISGWEGWISSRWTCTVEHAAGKVVSKRTYFLQ